MPNFSYRGRNGTGETVQGIMEGATAGAVADLLVGSGTTPIEIKPDEATAGAGGGVDLNIEIFKKKVEHIDILLFSKQIYTLLKAGVPIMRALAGLQESSTNPAMRDVLQDLRDSLDSGRELSAALARHPRAFDAFYVAMVRVGEMTGRLEEVFIRMFDHMEFERFMKEQVKSALRYPSFVVAAMVGAMAVVNVFVIPAFAKVFKGFGAELPLMTRILLNTSEFTVTWWPVILGGGIVLGMGFTRYTRTRIGRLWWDQFKLKIPIAGNIILKATLSRFARSFALASRSGVPIIQALSNVAATVDNAHLARKIEEMRDGVERGESILRTAIRTKVFTPVVIQMIAVGEESGALDDMMQEVADMYQNEVEYELKTLSQKIEPILIIVLGIMVLILALGIFLPMWDLGKVATKR
ncbi:MAG: type II secretion system F family protein [Rhodocyclaceae bacterium]|nr:MAG: type II secretion system F family protein [Rhodocyclaceae bacterium]